MTEENNGKVGVTLVGIATLIVSTNRKRYERMGEDNRPRVYWEEPVDADSLLNMVDGRGNPYFRKVILRTDPEEDMTAPLVMSEADISTSFGDDNLDVQPMSRKQRKAERRASVDL